MAGGGDNDGASGGTRWREGGCHAASGHVAGGVTSAGAADGDVAAHAESAADRGRGAAHGRGRGVVSQSRGGRVNMGEDHGLDLLDSRCAGSGGVSEGQSREDGDKESRKMHDERFFLVLFLFFLRSRFAEALGD